MIELRISKSPKLIKEDVFKNIVCFESEYGNMGIDFGTIGNDDRSYGNDDGNIGNDDGNIDDGGYRRR